MMSISSLRAVRPVKQRSLLPERLLPWLLAAGSLLYLLLFNGSTQLYGLDETKNAQCAREMLLRNDWIVPTFNGELRTDKPPLHYVFMGLAYRLFGVTEFAARFFSGVFGTLTVLLTYGFTRRYLGFRAGWLAALILLTSLHYAVQLRMSVPDPYLLFWLTLTGMAAFVGLETGRAGPFYVAYAGAALGMLTKGPVAVLLPGLVVALYLTVRRQWSWKQVKQFRLPAGLLLWAGLALPWFVAVHHATNGAWTDGFFFKHNLARFSAPMEGHGGFFGLPLLFVLAGLLPFSVFLPAALRLAWRSRQPVLRYSGLAALVVIGFFTFSSTRLPNYTVPAYPFLALLLGHTLDRLWRSAARSRPVTRLLTRSIRTYAIVVSLIPVAVAMALRADPVLHDRWWLGGVFVGYPLGAVVALAYWRRRQLGGVIGTMIVSFWLSSWALYGYAYPQVDARNPVRQSEPLLAGRAEVGAYKLFNPAFVFYRNRPIPVMTTPAELSAYLTRHPTALIITRRDWLPELAPLALTTVFRQRDLFERSETVMLQGRFRTEGRPNQQPPVEPAGR